MKNDSENIGSKHTIRLRGPCRLLWMHNGTQQAEVRVQIPCEIKPDLFELDEISADDRFVLQRNFGMPTGLIESQNVTLELFGFESATRVVLNRGKDLELAEDFVKDCELLSVAHALRAQNRLEVEFNSLPAVAGEVRLVIEE